MTTVTVPDLPMTAEDYAAMAVRSRTSHRTQRWMLEVAASAQMAWHSRTVRRTTQLLERDGRLVGTEFGVILGPRKVRIPDVTRMRRDVVVGPYDEQEMTPASAWGDGRHLPNTITPDGQRSAATAPRPQTRSPRRASH